MPPGDNRKESGRGAEPMGGKVLLIVLVVVGIVWLVTIGSRTLGGKADELGLSEFEQRLRESKVASCVIVQGDGSLEITGEYRSGGPAGKGRNFRVKASERQVERITELLAAAGVEYSFKPRSRFLEMLPYVLFPLVILGVFLYLMFRRMYDAQGGGALSFGKARARLVTKESVNVTFEDVAGIEEAKEEVEEIVEYLKNSEKFRRIGARIPRGVILMGAPGTGKTLLAKAIAGEADVPFFSMSGSDFVEMFVGVGASRVRDLFQQAKRNAPAIIFLDEIDAVGRRRGAGLGGGHDEREQTLNAILVEMDGFDTSDQVIVIASTNRPDVLDPALLRPGRFDRRVVVDMPDVVGREAILEVHAKKVKMADDTELSFIAKQTVSFSGADLENLINEAALLAVMRGHDAVQMEDIEEAREKVMWGKERRSRKLEDADRQVTAYHEAGHAVVAWFTEHVDKPHKVTIMPRGMSFLGATMKLPEKERYILTRRQLVGEVVALYGGRVAEERFCGDISSGAANDIKQATEIIRRMVTRWGMSDKLGALALSDEEDHVFLGYEITRQRQNSEATNKQIDAEIRRISDGCYERARSLVDEHAGDIERLAKILLEKEVLNQKDLQDLLGSHVDENGPGGETAGGETAGAETAGAETAGAETAGAEEDARADDAAAGDARGTEE